VVCTNLRCFDLAYLLEIRQRRKAILSRNECWRQEECGKQRLGRITRDQAPRVFDPFFCSHGYRNDAGRRALQYDHLVVRDGAGRELEARMAAPEEESVVWLEVDGLEAGWPATIPPTFTQQQKLESSDAAAFDFFGW
jgi:hypothetical protein